MAATPLLVLLNERVLAPRLEPARPAPDFDRIEGAKAPVIIAGFGRFGQIVGRLLRMARIPFTALETNPMQVDFVRRYGSKVYYGDPSRLDVLRAAGAGRHGAFVLAIDDVETSVRVAQAVRHAYPQLPVYARARNRQHAHRLMDLGARVIVRETFDSSLSLGRQLLEGLGWQADEAEDAARRFREHDERTLAQQRALRHDESALIQSVQDAATELEELFEYDGTRRRRHRRADRSGD
ncbi:MAG: NAD-binding protein [Halofilum sp. (in: g-proteobacteria)]|nr:NAD-binding protein [Halofilum sp. (in: g-proteobacteria)]